MTSLSDLHKGCEGQQDKLETRYFLRFSLVTLRTYLTNLPTKEDRNEVRNIV